jgi:hypothetical protein
VSRSLTLVAAAIAVLTLTFAQTPDRAAGARVAVAEAVRPPDPAAPAQRLTAGADTETMATGAGAGLFPEGAELNGVRLSRSTFGTGVLIFASGSAVGTFQTVLAGTSLLGLPQHITVEGKIGGGTRNADGSVTLSGSSIVDMGDGGVPSAGLPFSVTLSTGAIALVLGTTALPTQTLTGGGITIQ